MTKRAFFAYSLEGEPLDKLRQRFSFIEQGAKKGDWEIFAHIRDVQNWTLEPQNMGDVLDLCFREIHKSDAFIADFTVFKNKERTGIKIEAGYAKALNKKIISIVHNEDRPRMLTELADFEVCYCDVNELDEKIFKALSNLTSTTEQ